MDRLLLRLVGQAGQNDGSCTLRAMTAEELRRQSQQAAEASAHTPQEAC